MSRLAKKPIMIPQGVTVSEKDRTLVVKGPKGELVVVLPQTVKVEIAPETMMITNTQSSKQGKANVGTTWSLAKNAILGVTEGFGKNLEIEGVGYRAQMEGDTLVLSLGYVLPVRVKIPQGVAAAVEKNVIKITGMNKEKVGQIAAYIRSLKKPEPYKGKGIRYQGETIRRKVGKKAATAG